MIARAALLLLLTIAASLPQLLMTGWRGTEGRRVQIALEMVRSGDWMVPTIGFEPTWAKPPLHYWILGAASELFGSGPVAMRMPSVLALFLLALLAMSLLRRWFGEGAGWVGALAILCSPIVLFEWPTAEIDPIFAALTASSLWLLATGIGRERRKQVFFAGVLGGLALMQKGPPYLMFAAGAWLVWWRRRGFRRLLFYLLPLIAVPLCYYVPLWLFHVDPAEMMAIAQKESVGRISGYTLEHLLETPLFWLRAVFVLMPMVLWCFWEWRGERDARMDAGDLTLRMCSGGAVLAVLILSLFPGRPTRYLLPNVPLFLFAVSPAVAHFASQRRELGRFSRRVLRGFTVLSALGLLAMPFVVGKAGVALAGTLLAAALGWWIVRTPRQLVAYVLWLPLVAGWTVGFERALTWGKTDRATEVIGRVLRAEMRDLDVDPGELRTYGHVDGRLLLGGGLLPRGDEMCRSTPTSRWLLTERNGVIGAFPDGYVDRVWIRTRAGLIKLHERVPR